MKLGYLILLAVLPISQAFADSYLFSISDPNPAKIIHAKNCLDYAFCGGRMSSVTPITGGYLLSAFIDLDDSEISQALNACNLKQFDVTYLSVLNVSKGTKVSLPEETVTRFQSSMPTIYVKEMTTDEKLVKYNRIKKLIDANDRKGAIDEVIADFSLSTGGYDVKFGGDMGSAGAVTDHEAKTVTFSDSVFGNPCVLVQAIRHELEHVMQIAKVNQCRAAGKTHNLEDHYTRERSAYLNDIRNIPQFCPMEYMTNSLVSQFTGFFTKMYLKNP